METFRFDPAAHRPSFPRRREPKAPAWGCARRAQFRKPWIPACAGMTKLPASARMTKLPACAGTTKIPACAGMTICRSGETPHV
jgi:hypothetical protein